MPVAGDDQEIMDLFSPSIPLPPWFSEEDLATYASLYEKSGFRFALQVPYRYSNSQSPLPFFEICNKWNQFFIYFSILMK